MTSARSLVLVGPRLLEWREGPLREPGPAEVLLATELSAVSVGTERALYRGEDPRGGYPRMTGYQDVARVVACGADVEVVDPGDRVVACYGHRDHAVLPARHVVPVPAGTTTERALLVILSGDAARAVFRLRADLEAPILVTGAGVMGLLCTWTLAWLGARRVEVVDPLPRRRALALAMGATRALTPREAARAPGRYRAGLECSGDPAGFALLQGAAAPGARLVVVADDPAGKLGLTPDFHDRELTLLGSDSCRDYPRHARWFLEAASRAPRGLDALPAPPRDASELPAIFGELDAAADPPLLPVVRWG